jgi:hypothetical protein
MKIPKTLLQEINHTNNDAHIHGTYNSRTFSRPITKTSNIAIT